MTIKRKSCSFFSLFLFLLRSNDTKEKATMESIPIIFFPPSCCFYITSEELVWNVMCGQQSCCNATTHVNIYYIETSWYFSFFFSQWAQFISIGRLLCVYMNNLHIFINCSRCCYSILFTLPYILCACIILYNTLKPTHRTRCWIFFFYIFRVARWWADTANSR